MSPMSTTEQSSEHNRDHPQKHLQKIPEIPSTQSGLEKEDDEEAARGSTTSPEMLAPYSLGLNHIRTKSSPAPSPLGLPSVQDKPRVDAADARADARARWPIPPHQPDQGICLFVRSFKHSNFG